jgi:uncharacterized protein YjbJ (UPF0337 family)
MNRYVLQGRWREIKGQLRQTWGRWTHNEFQTVEGRLEAILGLMQQHQGMAALQAQKPAPRAYDRNVN